MSKVRIGSVIFDATSLEELILELSIAIKYKRLETVITPNLDMWFKIENNSDFNLLAGKFTRCIPDGMPIARAMTKVSGIRQHRVAGSDLLPRLIESQFGKQTKFCFVGGPTGVAKICANTISKYGLTGQYVNAPMNLLRNSGERAKLIDEIMSIDFDVLVLGFGFPLQEMLTAEISERRKRGIYLNVGMALLYFSGQKFRSPRILQNAGLEWLFRLCAEPLRLYRRYLWIGPRAYLSLRNKTKGKS